MAKVRRGVFLRRIMGLLVAAIILSAALTMLFYYTVTSDVVYVNLTQREFSKKASFIADESSNYLSGGISDSEYEAMLNLVPEMLDATVAVSLDIHEDGFILQPQGSDLDEAAIDSLLASYAEADGVLQDEVIQDRLKIGDPARDVVVVGYPIRFLDERTAQRSVRGMVHVVKSMETIRTGYASINFALIFASGIAVLLMLIPTYIAVSRLTRPLKQVKDVATAMSHGNFTLRADTEQSGEIGELAAAINDLASDLDRSISALLHERNRLQQILDGLSEGIIAVENDLTITHTNSAVAELLSPVQPDYDRDESEGHMIADLHELNREHDPYGLAAAFSETIGSEEAAGLDIDLQDRIIRVQITPLYDDQRRVIGAVGLLRDVTSTEALEKTRRDYVANVSHELRTPLTAMRGLIEPLSDGLVTDEQDRRRYYSIILDETLRLSRLIDDMLELSRLQAGTVSLRRERFSLWEIFDTLQATYTEMTALQNITFAVMDWDPDCPDGWSNPDRIEQVMVILIDNAIKFTAAGGIIELGVNWEGEHLIVYVKDTGSGIEAADVPHVFERFYKADKSRGQRGTGLGLSIAREMIESLGERIWVRSHVGQGSTFFFTITKYADQAHKTQ